MFRAIFSKKKLKRMEGTDKSCKSILEGEECSARQEKEGLKSAKGNSINHGTTIPQFHSLESAPLVSLRSLRVAVFVFVGQVVEISVKQAFVYFDADAELVVLVFLRVSGLMLFVLSLFESRP